MTCTRAVSRSVSFLLLICLLWGTGLTAHAAPTGAPAQSIIKRFAPNADALVKSVYPYRNYGTTTSLAAGSYPMVNSYLRFSVPDLNGATIYAAKLRLYATRSSSQDIHIMAVSDNTWGETSITYNNAPALGATLATSNPSFSSGTWITLDVSSYVTAAGTYSFAVTSTGTSPAVFASRETGSYAPKLILTTGFSIEPDILREATAPNNDNYRPLPLVRSWNAGTFWNYNTKDAGFSPNWQLKTISNYGYHFFPWFESIGPEFDLMDPYYSGYYEKSIKLAAAKGLPISFIGTQWEHSLYDDARYLSLPLAQNPNVVSPDGTVRKVLSPFGAIQPWYEVGYKWGSGAFLQKVITWYPDPPLVLFDSNNEANRLDWPQASKDMHFRNAYPNWRSMTSGQIRNAFAIGWTARYSQLIAGYRAGLQNSSWQEHSVFSAYKALYTGWFGEWGGWKEYSWLDDGKSLNYAPNYFEGGQAQAYIYPDVRDNMVDGPVFQSTNFPLLMNEAWKINPAFFPEVITWHGDTLGWQDYLRVGQTMSPERYRGMVQYIAWTATPRTLMEYDAWNLPRSQYYVWLQQVIGTVESVWRNQTLQSFWRSSTLLLNTTVSHPYSFDIPVEYQGINRMSVLSTSLDPPLPWKSTTQFRVFVLARSQGTSPNRKILVYGYAPLGNRSGVRVLIPGYKTLSLAFKVNGTFYLADEQANTVTEIFP